MSSINESDKSEESSSEPTTCEAHQKLSKLFCERCKIVICPQCISKDHNDHEQEIGYIGDPMHLAVVQNKLLDLETDATISSVKKAIEEIDSVVKDMEIKSNEVADEVRDAFSRYKTALEKRERYLLTAINDRKQRNVQVLLYQIDKLKTSISKMTLSSQSLKNSLSESTNSEEMQTLNQSVENHLQTIRAGELKLAPCKIDNILFTPLDQTLLNKISLTGNIGLSRAIYGLNHVKVKKSPLSITFGSEGKGDGQFFGPAGVCSDISGKIFVADSLNHRVQVFNSVGTFLFKFGGFGSSPGLFNEPQGMTINPKGHLLVADYNNNRIQVFKCTGSLFFAFGEKGSGRGQFNRPWDVACNAIGCIVVSDTENHRIQLFSNDGAYINQYMFKAGRPKSICFTPNGSVVVADDDNSRLVVVDSQYTSQKFIGGDGKGEFTEPNGVCCDDDGNIIVADFRTDKIHVLDSNENYLWNFGKYGEGPGELNCPHGICLNPEGRIVVADYENNRVHIF